MRNALLVAAALIAAPTGSTFAHNTYFLPGDAFFHAVLTEKRVRALDSEKSPRFEYHRPEELGGYFCGFAGFDEMEFADMPKGLKENLKKAYVALRKKHAKKVTVTDETRLVEKDGKEVLVPTGKKLETETNGFPAFFYNAAFDIEQHRIALKYNERWMDETIAFGHERSAVFLQPFVPTKEALSDEWRDAKEVEPLSVACPKVPKDVQTSGELEPVRVRSAVKVFILEDANYQRYHKVQDGTSFLEVTEKAIRRFVAEDGAWVVDKSFEPDAKPAP